MNKAYTIRPFAMNVDGEEVQSQCKTLTRNPGVGALIFLYPKNIRQAPFKYIIASYWQSTGLIKLWVQEYEESKPVYIGRYAPGNSPEPGVFQSLFNLFDIEEAWFQKIHKEGLDRILHLVRVIFSTNLALLEQKEPLESSQ